jgi:hypothetical protein
MGSRKADDSKRSPNRQSDSPHATRSAQSGQPLNEPPDSTCQTSEEALDEQRKIRRLQMMMNMVTSVISQDPKMTIDQAAELVADTKKAALAMFPDKELAYNLIYKPRLQRLMRERFRIQ